jgi:hypothetical protein
MEKVARLFFLPISTQLTQTHTASELAKEKKKKRQARKKEREIIHKQ